MELIKKINILLFILYGHSIFAQINATTGIKGGSGTQLQILVTDTVTGTGRLVYVNFSDVLVKHISNNERFFVGTGLPNYIPTTEFKRVYYSTDKGSMWKYTNSKWRRLDNIESNVTPFIDSLNYTNRDVKWYCPFNSNSYFVRNNVWESQYFSVDSIVARNNTFTGIINTFNAVKIKNTLTVDSSLTANGGMITKGSNTKSALKLQGAIAEQDTLIETDGYALAWTHGKVRVNTLIDNKSIRLPPIDSLKRDWAINLTNMTTDIDSKTLTILDSNGVFLYSITGNIIIKYKITLNSLNSTLQWKKEAISIY